MGEKAVGGEEGKQNEMERITKHPTSMGLASGNPFGEEKVCNLPHDCKINEG